MIRADVDDVSPLNSLHQSAARYMYDGMMILD